MTTLERRLADLKAAVERVLADAAEVDRRLDPYLLTDTEAVEVYRRFNNAPRGDGRRPRRTSPAEEAEIVATWREFNGR
jgi:hypothetical protein